MRQLIWGLILSLAAAPVFAKGGHSATHSTAIHTSHVSTAATHRASTKCASCARDTHGRIKRSSTAKYDFQRSHPCPSTGRTSGACPGYVIDHRTALKHGGADSSGNMQWQTTAGAKAKDRIE